MILPAMALPCYLITIGIITCFDVTLTRSAYWITPPTSGAWLRLLVLAVFAGKISGVAFTVVGFLLGSFLNADASILTWINGTNWDTRRTYVALVALTVRSAPFGDALRCRGALALTFVWGITTFFNVFFYCRSVQWGLLIANPYILNATFTKSRLLINEIFTLR